MRKLATILVLTSAALAGCESTGQKEAVGGVLGAAAGGLLGSQIGSGTGQIAATAAGAVGGLLLGSSVGRSLDDVDRIKQRETAYRSLESAPTGQPSSWKNPDTGHSGSVTPTRTYQRADGTYCREFTQVVNIGGKTEEAHGTACRQPDGTWKIVS